MTTSIYLMASERGPVKVGLAKNPALRLRGVQTGHPKKLRLLLSEPVDDSLASDVERRAHWLLKDHKSHGEWFTAPARTAKEAILRAVRENGEGEKAEPAVGRPPLNINFETKPTLVRLTTDILERIDALAGPNKRAEFIREAVERELKRREREAKR